eukprot:11580058-Ditylum_brightwellii.AAC.1
MITALYGILVSLILFYKKFRKDTEKVRFKVNPYNICIINHVISGSKPTISSHVDDIKASHVDSKVNNQLHEWSEAKYGRDLNSHVKVTRGKCHDYLRMILAYSKPGALRVDMRHYIKGMMEEFPDLVKATKVRTWDEHSFKADNSKPKLD